MKTILLSIGLLALCFAGIAIKIILVKIEYIELIILLFKQNIVLGKLLYILQVSH